MKKKNINRIKVVLAEKDKTNKWLSEQIHSFAFVVIT